MILDTVICGDCAKVLEEFPDECIDLTVTSPPYDNLRQYNGYVFDFESIAQQLYRVMKIGGIIVWVVGDETKKFSESLTSFKQAIYFVDVCRFRLLDTMIYTKITYPPAYPTLKRYANQFEYMFVFSKEKPKTFNPQLENKTEGSINRQRYKVSTGMRQRDGTVITKYTSNTEKLKQKTNIWHIFDDKKNTHPATFPEKLAEDHILSWSNPGDIILDPMCGSGTTLKMARKSGRHYIGIDISEEYCQLSRDRLNSLLTSQELGV